jgi:hypothetical protein
LLSLSISNLNKGCKISAQEAPTFVTRQDERPNRARSFRNLLRYGTPALLASLALAACGSSNRASSTSEHNSTSSAGSAAGSVPSFHPPSSRTFTEISDNHLGVAVFSSPEGAAVPNNVPGRIPYGVQVQVACVAPNLSRMSSVNDFYLVESGQWRGMLAVADSFANGGPMGPNPDNIDPHVPECVS